MSVLEWKQRRGWHGDQVSLDTLSVGHLGTLREAAQQQQELAWMVGESQRGHYRRGLIPWGTALGRVQSPCDTLTPTQQAGEAGGGQETVGLPTRSISTTTTVRWSLG